MGISSKRINERIFCFVLMFGALFGCERERQGTLEMVQGRSCRDAGGIEDSARCFCDLPKSYFDPTKNTCYKLTLLWVNEARQRESYSASPRTSTDGSPLLEAPAFCNRPAETVCVPEKNPVLLNVIERHNTLGQRYLDVMESKELESFFKPMKDWIVSSRDCSALNIFLHDPKGAKECEKRRDELILKQNPETPEAMQHVSTLFQEAREDAIHYLKTILETLRGAPEPNPKHIKAVEQAMRRVELTQLSFFGGQLVGLYAILGSDGTPYCSINKTMVLMAKQTPEAMRFFILHEFGHHVDPIMKDINDELFLPHHPEIPRYDATANPFHRIMDCMAPFTQSVDRSCVQEAAAIDPEGQKTVEKFLSQLERNPYVGQSFFTPTGELCSNNQFTETFADWFAVEVFSKSRLTQVSLRAHFADMTSYFCQSQLKIDAWKELSRRVSEIPRGDSHPPGAARINMMMAHPGIREALGCPKSTDFDARLGLKPVGYCQM